PLGGGQCPPVVLLERQCRLLAHYLHGSSQFLDEEAGPQRGMASDHVIPGALKEIGLELALNGPGSLLHVKRGAGLGERVEQDSLLHAREGQNILNVLHHAPARRGKACAGTWRAASFRSARKLSPSSTVSAATPKSMRQAASLTPIALSRSTMALQCR